MDSVEAYMDESGTHEGAEPTVVAGFVFKHEQAIRFSRDWQKVLDHYRLPYSHMKEASGIGGIYKAAGMSKDDCAKCNSLLIENTKRRSIFSFGASVHQEMYRGIVGKEQNAPSAYTFCLMSCMTILRRWAERSSYKGRIPYFFEAGNEREGEAQRFVKDALLDCDRAKEKARYASHDSIDKRLALPLQAADFLAWQFHHHHSRRAKIPNVRTRADFNALLRPRDNCIEHDETSLRRFRDELVALGWFVGRY